ncbi:MAG TPA: glycosyltransferase family 39 protein [Dehalococcoidia bacterium]|nr:glycosyltransferase family 39 protein [Dehalococcoidia bacterium]
MARVHWQVLTVAAITLGGLALRLVDVVDNPSGFFADEAAVGYLADLVLHNGKDQYGEFLPLFFRNFGDDKLPLVVYLDIPFVAILGRTELAVRGMVAIAGCLTIVTTYLLAKELFRRELPSILAAACLAIMPWHIHYGRTGFGETVLFLLLLTLGLYLLLRAFRLESSLLPAAFTFAISLYSYRAGWVVLPPLFLVIGALYWRELLRDRRNLMWSLGVLALFALPIVRHVLSDSSDRSEQAWIFKVESEKSTLQLFWEYYRSYFSISFLFTDADKGPILRHYLPGQGMLYWFQAPLLLMGLAACVMKPDRRLGILLALLVLCPLGGALSESSPQSLRALAQTLPLALLSALGLTFAIDLMAQAAPKWRLQVAYAALAVVAVVATLSLAAYLQHYYSDYPRLSAGFWGWQDGPQRVMSHFLTVQDDYDELFMDGSFNAPEVFIPFYTGKDCLKCHIGDSQAYVPTKRQLFALRPEALQRDRYDYVQKGEFTLAGGTPGFVFVEIARRR